MNRIIVMISILLCLTHCQTPVETNSSNNEDDRSWLPNWTPLINALEPTKDTPKTPEPPRTLANMYQDDQCARKVIKQLIDKQVIGVSHQLKAYCFENDVLVVGHTETDLHSAILAELQSDDRTLFDHTYLIPRSDATFSVGNLEHIINKSTLERPKHLRIMTDNDDVFLMGTMSKSTSDQLMELLTQTVPKDQIINHIRITS